MARRPPEKSPAALIGYVSAPDQEQAIAKAVTSFGISQQERWRIGAYKVKVLQP